MTWSFSDDAVMSRRVATLLHYTKTKTVFVPVHRIFRCVIVVKHLNTLLHCENYTEARKVMLDTIEDLVSTSKCRHSLRITEDLLLAPMYQKV